MRVKLCECETFLYFVKLRESSKLAQYFYLSNFTIAASRVAYRKQTRLAVDQWRSDLSFKYTKRRSRSRSLLA